MKNLNCDKIILLLILHLLGLPIAVAAQTRVLRAGQKYPGPESSILLQRTGVWDVSETVWPAPGASPVTTTGLVAERKMIGAMLQEFMSDPATNEVKRTDLLTYNDIEGRWDYVSFDARVPLGLMPAWSAVKGDGKSIALNFSPMALPENSNGLTGQMLRMDQTISYLSPDTEVKNQYFMLADGTASRWLAHQYAYVRRVKRTVQVPAPGKSSIIDEIKKRGTLRVAVVGEYPWLKPTFNGDFNPPFEGPAWILAVEFASRLGVTLETVPVDFEGKISAVQSGRADITIAPLLVTPERMMAVDMISYSLAAQTLFGKADNPKLKNITRIGELNQPEITIAYIEGSPQGQWLTDRLPLAKRLPVKGNLADVALYPILKGEADVANIDKFFFTGLAKENPGLISIPKDFMSSQELPIPIGMAIKKEQPVFLDWLKSVAAEIKVQVKAAEEAMIAEQE